MALLHKRNVELWLSSDYRWRELFEAADVVSEGAARMESEGRVYYGSTSIVLQTTSLASEDAARPRELARLVAADPHARLRAVRIACLEAQLRAGGPLGSVRAELSVRQDKRGVRIDVDVEARVHEPKLAPIAKTKRARGAKRASS